MLQIIDIIQKLTSLIKSQICRVNPFFLFFASNMKFYQLPLPGSDLCGKKRMAKSKGVLKRNLPEDDWTRQKTRLRPYTLPPDPACSRPLNGFARSPTTGTVKRDSATGYGIGEAIGKDVRAPQKRRGGPYRLASDKTVNGTDRCE